MGREITATLNRRNTSQSDIIRGQAPLLALIQSVFASILLVYMPLKKIARASKCGTSDENILCR